MYSDFYFHLWKLVLIKEQQNNDNCYAPGQTDLCRICENERGKLKFCMHPRAKVKHVLWLGDF